MTDLPNPQELLAARRFRKRPVVVEAIQWTGENYADVAAWLSDRGSMMFRGAMGALTIPTLEGDHRCDPNDWIIRGIKGEFYPCKPDIFAATYEPADIGVVAQSMADPQELLAAIQRLDAAATPGPWCFAEGRDNEGGEATELALGAVMAADDMHIARVWLDGPNPEADGHLLAAARTLLPQAAAVIGELQGELEAAEQHIKILRTERDAALAQLQAETARCEAAEADSRRFQFLEDGWMTVSDGWNAQGEAVLDGATHTRITLHGDSWLVPNGADTLRAAIDAALAAAQPANAGPGGDGQ